MFCSVRTNIESWFKPYIRHIGCNQVGVEACHMFICFDCAFSTGCVYRLKNGFKVSIDNEWCRDLKANKNVIRFIQSTPFFFHRYTTNVETIITVSRLIMDLICGFLRMSYRYSLVCFVCKRRVCNA